MQGRRLIRIEGKLDRLMAAFQAQGRIVMATLDDLLADVASESTVISSVETLLTNLSAMLAAAIATQDPAKVQAVKDAIDGNVARLTAAVTANTPAGP